MYLPGYKRKPTLFCSRFLLKSWREGYDTFHKISQQPPRTSAGISAPLMSFLLYLVKLFSSFHHDSQPWGLSAIPQSTLGTSWAQFVDSNCSSLSSGLINLMTYCLIMNYTHIRLQRTQVRIMTGDNIKKYTYVHSPMQGRYYQYL